MTLGEFNKITKNLPLDTLIYFTNGLSNDTLDLLEVDIAYSEGGEEEYLPDVSIRLDLTNV